MKEFMDKDFLLGTETARRLFHSGALAGEEYQGLLAEIRELFHKAGGERVAI